MTRISLLLFLVLQAASSEAQAQSNRGGISLEQTRVIFSAADKAQTVAAKNTADRNYLLQVQVQNGLEDASPAPFIVTPPLSLLKGNSRQLLRILPQGATLPGDRESLFYLSVAAIPAQDQPVAEADRLSVGVRFLVKLFYRPEGLALAANMAPCKLVFSRVAHGVRVSNPTPYFQTLAELTLNGRTVALDSKQAMVAPQDSNMLTATAGGNNVTWKTIADHGGLSQSCQQTLAASQETTR